MRGAYHSAMDGARVGEPSVRTEGEVQVVEGRVRVGAEEHSLTWRVTGAPVVARAETLLSAAFLPAMVKGGTVEVEAPVSPVLLGCCADLSARYRSFDPHLRPIEVKAPARAPGRGAPGVGLFFSGGLDGFYCLSQRLGEVTHLILVHGLDYRPEDVRRREIVARLTRVAERTSTRLVEVETDLLPFLQRFPLSKSRTPGQAGLGAALAGIATMLAPVVGRVYVPSSATAASLQPFGSHPLIDPLWSVEEVELVHDAIAMDRIERADAVGRFEPAYDALRPCGRTTGALYNCGLCRKCLWTMLMLESSGALGRFTVFPDTLEQNLGRLHVEIKNPIAPWYWVGSVLRAVERLDPGGPDAESLRELLRGRTRLAHWRRRQIRRGLRSIVGRALRRARGRGAPPASEGDPPRRRAGRDRPYPRGP